MNAVQQLISFLLTAVLITCVLCEQIIISDGQSPSSPSSVGESTVTDGSRVKGRMNLKQQFSNLVKVYCSKDDLADDQLEATQSCFWWRIELDTEILARCEDVAYGSAKSLNDRRHVQCSSRNERKKLKREFWKCYMSEATQLASTGDDGVIKKLEESRRQWKDMSREDRKEKFKEMVIKMMRCMESALGITTVNED